MRYLALLIFVPVLLLGVAGVAFTSKKLHKMKQIRGWEPGAVIEWKIVHDRWETADPRFDEPTYWISITEKSIKQPGDHRLNLPKSVWEKYDVGSEIEIVYLPNERGPYHRDGIYSSDGNFAFDRVLLFIEAGMIVFSVIGAGFTAVILRMTGKRRPKSPRRDRFDKDGPKNRVPTDK